MKPRTQKERLEELLTEMGVTFKTSIWQDDLVIEIDEGSGYWGFRCLFFFTRDGKCKGYSCYE